MVALYNSSSASLSVCQPQAYWQFAVSPASLSELCVYEQGAILTRLNDTHHLCTLSPCETG